MGGATTLGNHQYCALRTGHPCYFKRAGSASSIRARRAPPRTTPSRPKRMIVGDYYNPARMPRSEACSSRSGRTLLAAPPRSNARRSNRYRGFWGVSLSAAPEHLLSHGQSPGSGFTAARGSPQLGSPSSRPLGSRSVSSNGPFATARHQCRLPTGGF